MSAKLSNSQILFFPSFYVEKQQKVFQRKHVTGFHKYMTSRTNSYFAVYLHFLGSIIFQYIIINIYFETLLISDRQVTRFILNLTKIAVSLFGAKYLKLSLYVITRFSNSCFQVQYSFWKAVTDIFCPYLINYV